MKRIGLIVALGLMIALTVGTGVASGGTTNEFQTHDDLLAEVGRRVPEFGGMYLSEDNSILYVYLTDGVQDGLRHKAVKEAIEQVFKSGLTTGRTLRIVPAQYTMSQLYGWYRQMMFAAFANSTVVVMTDLDEGQNRLEIGVESLNVVPDLERMLANLSIPREAVVISERERPISASHTLRDRATGGVIEGGYQISSSIGDCTLGFNTVRSGEAGFVTAGHCTESNWDGGVDGTEFYQPDDSSDDNLIGEETIDPQASSTISGCMNGKRCRRSDSAFARLESGVSQNLGKIAKPIRLGSRTVNHNSKFRIVKEVSNVGVFQVVHSVGRTNGWIRGVVRRTCINVPKPSPSDVYLLCQNEVAGVAAGGDSGASVFKITDSPQDNDVELLGILWGYHTKKDIFWYSPIGYVYHELGRGDTWNSCDPSRGC